MGIPSMEPVLGSENISELIVSYLWKGLNLLSDDLSQSVPWSLKCIRVAAWQNQQNDLCAQRRLWSVWADGIRVFAVRMKKHWILSYQITHSKDSDQTGRMPRLVWVFARRSGNLVGFVMLRLNYFYAKWTLLISKWVESILHLKGRHLRIRMS